MYSQKFLDAFDYVMRYEGGLNEDPDDKGGITNFGISIKFLKTTGDKYCKDGNYEQYIRSMTIDQAKEIYHAEFWLEVYEEIYADWIRKYIFDMAVNHGHSIAHKLVQRACYVADSHWYREIINDGIFGEQTLNAVLEESADYLLFFKIFKATRAQYYHCIVSHHPEQEKFLEGWLRRAYGI